MDDVGGFQKIRGEHYGEILAPSGKKKRGPSDFFQISLGMNLVYFCFSLGNLLHIITQDEIANLEMLNWK